ncbi:hypothetical protein GA0061098_103156 [Bradyrhizobium shewense]|uniref:Uncharacterized protein n=1 Tax=Bradyrhizobium shewense TaxID=1761772 RepID=A0A1C3XRJ0_9BRAD|nr:hypothetical protein GA0061098_103156 [Bradyrhizobium shewense]
MALIIPPSKRQALPKLYQCKSEPILQTESHTGLRSLWPAEESSSLRGGGDGPLEVHRFPQRAPPVS